MIKEVLEQTCKFFWHPINKINLLNCVFIYALKYGLRLFEVLKIICIFLIEIIILNRDILVNNKGLKKIKYVLFYI